MRRILYFISFVFLLYSCEMEQPTVQQGNLNDIKGNWKADNRQITGNTRTVLDFFASIYEPAVSNENVAVEFQIDNVCKIIVTRFNNEGVVTQTQEFANLSVSYVKTSLDGLDDVSSLTFYNPTTPHVTATEFVRTYSFKREGDQMILSCTSPDHNNFFVYKAKKL